MFVEREYQNALRNNSSLRIKSEQMSRYSSSNQNTDRFQNYLKSRGCPMRLTTQKTDEIRWIG